MRIRYIRNNVEGARARRYFTKGDEVKILAWPTPAAFPETYKAVEREDGKAFWIDPTALEFENEEA